MLHFEESMQIIENLHIDHYKTKKLYLLESLGYVLAEDIVADHNSPAYPTSAMDGYALRHEDMAMGRLKIASINPAGSMPQTAVPPWTAADCLPETSKRGAPLSGSLFYKGTF